MNPLFDFLAAAPDSFWGVRYEASGTSRIVRSNDLMEWSEVGLDGASPQSMLFPGDAGGMWIAVRTSAGSIRVLQRIGDGWIENTPPSAPVEDYSRIGGCRVGDDDLWLVGVWTNDDAVAAGTAMHWDGERWGDVEFPHRGEVVACSATDLWVQHEESATGHHLWHQHDGDWTEVTFADEHRIIYDASWSATRGAWLTGWSQDLESGIVTPRIWHVEGDAARDTLGGQSWIPDLAPRINGVNPIQQIVVTESAGPFAFGDDGLILEYVGD